MKYFKKIIGERIYLSPVNFEDIERFTEWMNDFETTDYIGKSSQIITLDGEKKYLEESRNNGFMFSIITMNEDKVIGRISLVHINYIDRKANLGILIGDKKHRENGYGTEAIRLILDYGFNYLNLNNIKLDLMEFNERALACYQKCGFKEYGRRRKCNFVNGKYYDTIEMDIISQDFKENYIKNKNIK